jgi:N utilization substance protein B
MKQPGKRREGRELAVQLLFQLDHNSTPLDEVLPLFFAFKDDHGDPIATSKKACVFAEELVRGVLAHHDEVDGHIRAAAANFALQRIGGVERAILRLAIFEMLHALEVPPVVAINEAVEIAKKYAGPDAPRFVNGVLDHICAGLDRPARTPAPPLVRMQRQMAKAAPAASAEAPGAPPPPSEPS